MLLDTHWDLTEIELGVLDKVFDTTTGKTFYEKKVIRTKMGGIIDVQWIKDRKSEDEFIEEEEAMAEETPEDERYTNTEQPTKEEVKEQLPASESERV